MGIPRYAAAVDRNQQEIVKALRDAGCDVYILKKPVDLAVGRAGKTYLLEVKVPKAKGERGGRKTDEQEKFFANWRGHVAQVETVGDALKAVGLKEK